MLYLENDSVNMNYLYIIFLLVSVFTSWAVVNADSITPTNDLEKQISVLFSKWRKGSVQTNLFPLPSLKSINISPIDNHYDGRGVKITFSIGNMTLTGSNDFSVEYLNATQTFDNLDISVRLTVPVLTLYADRYKLKGRAYYFYSLQGDGNMRILFRNIDASIFIRFANINGISIKISDFSLKYKIAKVDANLENSSWPINQVLNREGAEIIENYHDEIVNAIKAFVLPYANDYLNNVTPDEFLKIITDISVNSYVIEDSNEHK